MFLKVYNLSYLEKGIGYGLLIEQFQNQYSQAPNINPPGMLILINVLQPRPIEVFTFILKTLNKNSLYMIKLRISGGV